MDYGFLRVAAVVPKVNVADCEQNVKNIIEYSKEASSKGAKLIVFPELSITAYTCGDLFEQSLLLNSALKGLLEIKEASKEIDGIIVVGAPLRSEMYLFNCAVVIVKGEIIGVVPKTYLPNYKECQEKRWFTSGGLTSMLSITIGDKEIPFGTNLLFVQDDIKIAIEFGADLCATIPTSSYAVLSGANVIVNLSATNESIGVDQYKRDIIKCQSSKCITSYIYASAGNGESTTDLVFAGSAIIAENGIILDESERYALDGTMSIADVDIERINSERRQNTTFADSSIENHKIFVETSIMGVDLNGREQHNLLRIIDKHPFVPVDAYELNKRCEDVVNIQVAGLIKRLTFTGMKTIVLGVSGGLDSTLALLVYHKAFSKLGYDLKNIVGITMPGFGTTDRTYTNALDLMTELGITQHEISIKKSVLQHFEDIGHDVKVHDTTYENSQARERTQILMDYANRCNGMVIGTGDLSELALGWATYNGDHMSMYGINGGVPKTLVRYLVRWFALNFEGKKKDILLDIVDTPISPELVPADEQGNIKQKTEDLVGPYELHDFFLYNMLRCGFSPRKIYYLAKQAFEKDYDNETIKKWLCTFCRRFFQQQFKRSCLPDGPKIGSVGLSPRGDWRMPSDASAKMWLKECEDLLD